MKNIFLLIASFIMMVNAFAQEVNATKLDSLFNLLEANH
jgi:hypothetical protein